MIQSTWFRPIDRNPQEFEYLSGEDTDFQKATQRIFRSGEGRIAHRYRLSSLRNSG